MLVSDSGSSKITANHFGRIPRSPRIPSFDAIPVPVVVTALHALCASARLGDALYAVNRLGRGGTAAK